MPIENNYHSFEEIAENLPDGVLDLDQLSIPSENSKLFKNLFNGFENFSFKEGKVNEAIKDRNILDVAIKTLVKLWSELDNLKTSFAQKSMSGESYPGITPETDILKVTESEDIFKGLIFSYLVDISAILEKIDQEYLQNEFFNETGFSISGEYPEDEENLDEASKEKLKEKLKPIAIDRIERLFTEIVWSEQPIKGNDNNDQRMTAPLKGLSEEKIKGVLLNEIDAEIMFKLKQKGFSDKRLSVLLDCSEEDLKRKRKSLNVKPVFKRVDSCAAEFDTQTAYLYSTYQSECEANPTSNKKIMILGGGPNRIGQGIEFDYCCVHASLALQKDGYETIMVNCNPETVSTDYDISDRLYFEPLTLEDVLAVIDVEKPKGIIVHYGGQTPLKLAAALEKNGAKIIGTSPDSIDQAEDRERFQKMIQKLGLKQPINGTARSQDEAVAIADSIGFPLVVRPSYVLGGRAMEIVYDKDSLYFSDIIDVDNELNHVFC